MREGPPEPGMPRAGRVLIARVAFLLVHWAHAALVLWPRALSRHRSPRRREPRKAAPPPAATAPVGGIEEFERHANLYDGLASPFTVPLFRLALERIRPLPPSAAILDLGCGPGRELCRLLAHSEVQRAVGVDLSATMTRLARRRTARESARAELITADAAQLPDELGGQFDLVLASLAHHHFPNPDAVAAQAYRALRPDGRYCVIDYGTDPVGRLLTLLAPIADPGWCGVMDPEELAGVLHRNGFCRVSWSPLAPGVGVAIAERAERHPA